MRIRTFAAAVAIIVVSALAIIGVTAAVTAISNTSAVAANYTPTSYGPTVNGHCYSGYIYDPIEADQFGDWGHRCDPYLYPANPPIQSAYHAAADYLLAQAMWNYLLANDHWVHGSYYYDHILLPSSRHTTTIIVNRNTYISDGNRWNSAHLREHNAAVKTYPPTFKKAGDKSGKVFKGDDFASKANKAADLTKTQTAKKNNGGNAGAVADPAKAKRQNSTSGGYTGSANAAERAGNTPTTGRSGGRR